jgi:hypothetical protein
MVIPKLPKLEPWVRFPSPAPIFALRCVPVLSWDAPALIVWFPRSRCGYNVPLIGCVDRPLGRAPWSHPSVIDPASSLMIGGFMGVGSRGGDTIRALKRT